MYYEDLKNAIIIQAVRDRDTSFFRGPWFEMLSDMDGEEIARKIEQRTSANLKTCVEVMRVSRR